MNFMKVVEAMSMGKTVRRRDITRIRGVSQCAVRLNAEDGCVVGIRGRDPFWTLNDFTALDWEIVK